MTRLPKPSGIVAHGPFETEAQALAVVGHIYAAARASSRRGVLAEGSYRLLCSALSGAGVEVGDYDHRIVLWMTQVGEPQACAVLAGLITRAHAAGATTAAGSYALGPSELPTVLDALDVAADYKRDRAASCPECQHAEGGLCTTCGWRLSQADEYDALTGKLREQAVPAMRASADGAP